MASAFLDLSGLSHFLDKLRLLIVQSDWQQSNSSEMDYIRNKPTISVDGTTLVLTGWTEAQPVVEYSVRFLLNDGTEAVYATETVESGATVSAPATAPTRTGYDFGGWFADAAGATAFDFSAPITANTDIYAKWTEQAANTVTITVQGLENQTIGLSSSGTLNFDYSTGTGTLGKGDPLIIDCRGADGFRAGNLILNGEAQTSTHADMSAVDSDLVISAAAATKILVDLGNYSGTMTVGSMGDPTTQYGGAVGFLAGQFGSMSPASWGEFAFAGLVCIYGRFAMGVSGTDDDTAKENYANSCITGTLTVGTFSAQVSGGQFVDSANTEAFRAYLAQHVGETLSVTFNLSALDGYTKTVLTVGEQDDVGAKGFMYMAGGAYAAGSLTPNPVDGVNFEMIAELNGDFSVRTLPALTAFTMRYGDGSGIADSEKNVEPAFGTILENSSVGDTFNLYVKAGS